MNGYITKYFENRFYGFILGEDKQSYYFHKNNIDIDIVSLGQLVIFEPLETDQGLKAINIKNIKTSGFIFDYHDQFTSKNDNDSILLSAEYIANSLSASGDSPDEAKEKLFKYIKSLGANGVRGLEYFKTKGEDGNYIYTIHNYRGNPALIFNKTPSNDNERIKMSKNTQIEIIKSFELKYQGFISENKKNNSTSFAGPIVFVIFILIFIALTNQHVS
jgi:hypothetical protein